MSAFLAAQTYDPVQVFSYGAPNAAEIRRPQVNVQISNRMICGEEGYYEYCEGRYAYVWGNTYPFKEWLKVGQTIVPVPTIPCCFPPVFAVEDHNRRIG